MRTMQDCTGAFDLDPMVLSHGSVARSRAGKVARPRQASVRSTSPLRKTVLGLAREFARLDHLAPALVGPSDSGLVHDRLRIHRRCVVGRSNNQMMHRWA